MSQELELNELLVISATNWTSFAVSVSIRSAANL